MQARFRTSKAAALLDLITVRPCCIQVIEQGGQSDETRNSKRDCNFGILCRTANGVLV